MSVNTLNNYQEQQIAPERHKESPETVNKKRSFTNLALRLALIGATMVPLAACNSAINQEAALKLGLSPDVSSPKAPNGGCLPEIEGKAIPLADGGYGQFITGGKECRASKVIDSPNLNPGETADMEFIAMPGDDFPMGRPKGARDFEEALRVSLGNHPSFKYGKIRIRVVSRLGHAIDNIGRSSIGENISDDTESYTDNAADSFSDMLNTLTKTNSSKIFSLLFFSGAGTTGLNALSRGSHNNIKKATMIENWCDIDLIKTKKNLPFSHSLNPKTTFEKINPNIELDFVLSSNGDYLSKLGTESCVQELKKLGRDVELHIIPSGKRHLETLSAEALTLPNNSIYASLPRIDENQIVRDNTMKQAEQGTQKASVEK